MGVLRNQKNEKTFVDLTENYIKIQRNNSGQTSCFHKPEPGGACLPSNIEAWTTNLVNNLIMVKSGSNHCQVVTGTIKHLLLHQYDNTVLVLTCSSLVQTWVAQIHINGLILRKLNRLIFFSLSCCLGFLCHYWCDCFSYRCGKEILNIKCVF